MKIMDTGYIQEQIRVWVETRLGVKAMHTHERALRSLEETLELGQTLAVTREEAHKLVDHVFDKEVGDTYQELGGAALTLLACASGCHANLGDAIHRELTRIYSLPMEKFQKRQAENIANGIGE